MEFFYAGREGSRSLLCSLPPHAFCESLSGSMNLRAWNSCSSSISMRCARWPARVRLHWLPDRLVSCLVRGSTGGGGGGGGGDKSAAPLAARQVGQLLGQGQHCRKRERRGN